MMPRWKLGYAPVELGGENRGRVLEGMFVERKDALRRIRRLRKDLRKNIVVGIIYISENVY